MAKKRRKYQKSKPPLKRISQLAVALFLLLGFGLVGFIFFNPWVWRLDLRSELERNKIASTVFDRSGQPVVTLYAKTRLWTELHQIEPKLREAVIATEDNRFYLHKGIDIRGIARALYQDIKAGQKLQGGSTITQQLVKNLFFSHEKRVSRKILEMAYAIRIEQQYRKDEILEFYLNSIYLGHGTWGVAGAAEVYFGKSVSQLTVSESALIAGLAKSPEFYSPFRDLERARRRRDVVLELMKRYGYLDEAQYAVALQEEIRILNKPGAGYPGGYFVDYVIEVLKQETDYSENQLRSEGLKIYTTMDRKIQRLAEQAFDDLPAAGVDRWGMSQPQGALVALSPSGGEILALVGGRQYSATQVNRAFQLYRQPGSALKPFVFAAALEAGYGPETMMEDRPLEIEVNQNIWRPQNYNNEYRGWISLQSALEDSVNTIAIQLVQNIGIDQVYNLIERMGINSLVREGARNDRGLAPLALGGLTRGVTLLDMTTAYSAFANFGNRREAYGITRVYDRHGKLIYQGRSRETPVISEEIARILTEMMRGVIRRGTGVRARAVENAAGKTGTTNQNTNGWFIGYTDQILAGIWLGNDRADEPLVVNGVPLGSGTAAAIWGEFVRKSQLDRDESPPGLR